MDMDPKYMDMDPKYMDMDPKYMDPNYLKTYFIYTSHENNIMQIKETQLLYDDPETISKMRLIQKIQEMKRDEFGKYILKNIALHHIILDDNNIRAYVDDKITHESFFNEITYLSDIKVHATNSFFQPLSSLYVILQEKPHKEESHNNTKKIKYSPVQSKKLLKRKSLKQKF